MSAHHYSSLNKLIVEIENRRNDFNGKRRKNQRSYNLTSKGQIIASSITTFLIAINVELDISFIAFLAIGVSALSSVFGSFLAKYMYSERLAHNIQTVCALSELKFNIEMDMEKEMDDPDNHRITMEVIDEFKDRYQNILDQANSEWQKNLKISRKKK
ncbi:SLATT domain-containing protein [Alcanivorax profundi]|uniref:SLATT domain-containing protein n=1 Tax=Alcanivorax profundi TaxID=2338368 RepID=UPI0013140BF2|nr:SLATT domain-containing protein [Alcanivorax profundi]